MSSHVLIIAEAGINHNGDLALAKEMVRVAASAGADFIKFHTYVAERVISQYAPKAEYQKQYTDQQESQLDMSRKLQLTHEDHYALIACCEQYHIQFLSSAFDVESIDFLNAIGLPTFKIPSGEITHLPYLRKIAKLKKKIILSTGMAALAEIKEAIHLLTQEGLEKKDITILHCNTEYPTPYEDVNLKAMLTIQKELDIKVGYSDHTLGIEVPIAAVALGACVIEKHFTLNRSMPGPDQAASLEPAELKVMVQAIRHIEQSLGHGMKIPSNSEKKNVMIARKSIVASQRIKRGEKLTIKNLAVKRPGDGVSPMQWDMVLGLVAKRDFEKDELIEL